MSKPRYAARVWLVFTLDCVQIGCGGLWSSTFAIPLRYTSTSSTLAA
jgi:hypothetical protein